MILSLGTMSGAGTLPLVSAMPCCDFVEDTPVYLQAVAVGASGMSISNLDILDVVNGDCEAGCEGGIQELVLQTV